jgi:hypothetical protein
MTYPNPTRRRPWVRFGLHYVEMVIAMFAGMMIFGALESGVLAAADLSYSSADRPVLASTTMTVYMALGMAVWMRVRRHDWPGILEMSGVMFVPVAVLAPLEWAGAISGDALMGLMHAAMFPLMLAVMLRRRGEYAGKPA